VPVTIRCRELIIALSSAAASPLATQAQHSDRMRRVGVLMSPREDGPEAQARARMLSDGLGELGWIGGRNIHVDYRWAGGEAARAQDYAAGLVSLAPDLIIRSFG